MRATLHFKLPEESSEHYHALHGIEFAIVLQDLDDYLRKLSKYEDKKDVPIDEVREKLWSLLKERGVELWRE